MSNTFDGSQHIMCGRILLIYTMCTNADKGGLTQHTLHLYAVGELPCCKRGNIENVNVFSIYHNAKVSTLW
jgi:hypothetical protein